MAACMIDHGRAIDRPWSAMHAVMDASMMIGHGSVHDRPWPCPCLMVDLSAQHILTSQGLSKGC